tara:strand:+ start:233 stop:1003 length:771 start_codon:yes stop_codon:yes gene_type:complete
MSFKSFLRKIPIIKRVYPSVFTKCCKIINKVNFIYKFREVLLNLNVHEPIDKSILLFNYYEDKQINYFLNYIKKNKVDYMLDVGANSGVYSLTIAEKFKKLKIISFEPIKKTFLKLKKNISLNGNIKNIKIYNFGLSDSNTKLRMKALVKNNHIQLGGFGVLESYDKKSDFYTETALFKSADNFLKYKNKSLCLKIDVEGHELFTINGLKKILSNNKIFLQIEIFNKNYKKVYKKLKIFGFKRINRIENDYYFIKS